MAASTSEKLRRWLEKQPISGRVYKTKRINFSEKKISIILENEPCPLIAICNVLLLRDKHDLKLDVASEEQLLEFVTEHLFNSADRDENDTITLADAIDLTRSLPTCMKVDVKFTRIDDFDLVKENRVFDLLGIRLVHGWIVDPQDIKTSKAIGSKSYDTLMGERGIHLDIEAVSVKKSEKDNVEAESSSLITTNSDGAISEPTSNVIEASSSSASKSDVNEVELIKSFLDNNASQLTLYGLYRLQEDLKDQELCVFFRNNHFNTMLKHLGQLYILVTNEAYMDEPGVVWENLIEVNGNTVYLNCNFQQEEMEDTKMKAFEDFLHGFLEQGSSSFDSNVKSTEKKDRKTTMNMFLDNLIKLEEAPNSSPEEEKIPEPENKHFKDTYAKLLNPEETSWILSHDDKEVLKQLGLNEKDFEPRVSLKKVIKGMIKKCYLM